MAKHNILGMQGEEIAARYMVEHGYTVLDRNWRSGHKELDMVARRDDTLVFLEVKTRCGRRFGNPQDAVDVRKIMRTVNAADAYIRHHALDMDVRFDIFTVVFENGTYTTEHIEDAFYPPLQ